MSILVPKLSFKLKTKDWQIQTQREFELNIRTSKETIDGWIRVVLVAKNKTAKELIKSGIIFGFYQNQNNMFANLLAETDNKIALVFLRHKPLKSITLNWHFNTQINEAPEFTLEVKQISTAKAWFHMLTYVSRQYEAAGGSRSYIYRISRARSKRAGVHIALEKLIKEYQPQLANQLISCEPYSYWQQQQEPGLLAIEKCAPSHPEIGFCLIIRSKNDQRSLLRSIQSIQRQSHPNWQLLLPIQEKLITPHIKELSDLDIRIHLCESVAIPIERWVLFLDEGDELSEDALRIFAAKIAQKKCALIYSDHDLMTANGFRTEPNYKPQWNPDLLMHQNYIGGAFAVHSNLLNTVSTTSQWWLMNHYPLLLHIILVLPSDQRQQLILRIPCVLFHQASQNQKLGFHASTSRLIKKLLHNIANQNDEKILRIKKSKADNIFHLKYEIPSPQPLVSLIIPTRDALEITRTCVNSILHLTYYPHYEIIIVDNQSQELETLAWFEQISQLGKVRVIRYDQPFNYSAINNFAVKNSKGSIIGLINNDTEVINKNWLTEMLQHACRAEIGCVGAKLYFHDDTIQHGGVILGLWGLAGHSHKNYHRYARGHQSRLISVQNLSAVTAACLLIRKSVFEEVGGLEEQHLTVAFNDVDLCLKVLKAGYRNIWTPYAELYHYESKSRGNEDTLEKKAREQQEIRYMQQKWAEILADDPHYNPNLTLSREDFTINLG